MSHTKLTHSWNFMAIKTDALPSLKIHTQYNHWNVLNVSLEIFHINPILPLWNLCVNNFYIDNHVQIQLLNNNYVEMEMLLSLATSSSSDNITLLLSQLTHSNFSP